MSNAITMGIFWHLIDAASAACFYAPFKQVKISLHGAGAIADMVNLVANKQWGKALIVTDGQLVKLGGPAG
ncbi:Lactaldehyde reductase [Salmonella enterica]|nr:Lactaldehyde reductase [Salmonella enterica]